MEVGLVANAREGSMQEHNRARVVAYFEDFRCVGIVLAQFL